MSKKIVEELIMNAKRDPALMQAILKEPLETLAKYDLTDAERDFFRNTDEKTLRGLSPACFQLAEKKK